jgi:hypothetical protein
LPNNEAEACDEEIEQALLWRREMHIIIGDVPPLGQPARREIGPNGRTVEARILDVRPPRRQRNEKTGSDRRRQPGNPDPVNGKVLTLLAPEGHNIPADLDSGRYRVFLKIVPR